MKLIYLFLGTLVLSGVSNADIDLSKSYSGNTMWGYSGLELREDYSNTSINTKKELKEYELKNASIRRNIENLTRYLENDNKDTENILSLSYSRFNSDKYRNNTYSLLGGVSKNSESRIGLKFDFTVGDIKVDKKKLKEETYTGAIFYKEKNYTLISYIGKSKFKDSKEDLKSLFYGVYGKYIKELPEIYLGTFEYLIPSVYLDTQIQRYKFKIEDIDNKNNSMLNSTLGLEFKNELEIDDIKFTTTLNIGYNREFFKKKKYRRFNEKETALDNLVAGLEIAMKYTELIDVYANYNIKKSLNDSKYLNTTGVGVRIRF